MAVIGGGSRVQAIPRNTVPSRFPARETHRRGTGLEPHSRDAPYVEGVPCRAVQRRFGDPGDISDANVARPAIPGHQRGPGVDIGFTHLLPFCGRLLDPQATGPIKEDVGERRFAVGNPERMVAEVEPLEVTVNSGLSAFVFGWAGVSPIMRSTVVEPVACFSGPAIMTVSTAPSEP